jgi:hypothetical protein
MAFVAVALEANEQRSFFLWTSLGSCRQRFPGFLVGLVRLVFVRGREDLVVELAFMIRVYMSDGD